MLENELLRVVVLADKGADIYQFVHKPTDVDFMWRAPMGVRDPSKFMGTTASPEFPWMDVYEGGWQTVLPSGGAQCRYRGADLGDHAEVNTMPWDCAVTEDSPDRVSLRCRVRTYRTPFFFEKTLSLESGSAVLSIEEDADQRGGGACPLRLGAARRHRPALSERRLRHRPARRTALQRRRRPRQPPGGGLPGRLALVRGQGRRARRPEPRTLRRRRQGLGRDLRHGTCRRAGTPSRTGDMGVGFGLAFPAEHFRYLWYWQSFRGLGYPWYGKAYNIGLEPFTSYGNAGVADAAENGSALLVQPGQSVSASLKAVAYTGAARVRRISPAGAVVRES